MRIKITISEFIDMYEKAEVSEVVVVGGRIYGRTNKHHGDYDIDNYIVWADMS